MMENIKDLKAGMNSEISAFQNVVDNIVAGLSRLNKQKLLNVQAESMVDLVENEKIEETKKVMKTLNDRDELIEVLDDDDSEISAVVADDNGQKCSVVKAPIIVGGNKVASIGVFGPQKMDYMGIASALKVLVDELNKEKGDT